MASGHAAGKKGTDTLCQGIETMMDALWMKIVQLIMLVESGLDLLLQPVNAIHPGLTIALLAVCTVMATSEFKKRFKTKRYLRLEKEFQHWYAVRQQALEASDDPSKGREMAKNIDQSTLNKVYYDYFFEGLMNNLLTTYIPVLCLAAYINQAFKPEALQQMIGQPAILSLPWQNGTEISGLAVFVFCLAIAWLAKTLLKKVPFRFMTKDLQETAS